MSAQRTTGLWLGGVAGAALAAAIVVGLLPFGAACSGPTRAMCAADAQETQALLLGGLLVATVLLAVAAIVAMLLAPKRVEGGAGWAMPAGRQADRDASEAPMDGPADAPHAAVDEGAAPEERLPGQAPSSGLRSRRRD